MRVRLEDDIVHVDETAVASSELLLNLRNRVDDAGLVPVALSACASTFGCMALRTFGR